MAVQTRRVAESWLRLAMASSLSGQAQARAPCQAAPPGAWVRCRLGREAEPDIPGVLPGRERLSPRPGIKSTPPPGLAHENPFVCPALPSRPTSKSPHAPSPLTPGPVQAAPTQSSSSPPTSESFPAPPPPGLPFPSLRLGQAPLWAPTTPGTS